ncbi:MAG TPA: hypothetical protein VMF56_10320 [Acidobacteriaceae bacterium]|nr:hypothetical protein [Acidobacteriaceae bacterium]
MAFLAQQNAVEFVYSQDATKARIQAGFGSIPRRKPAKIGPIPEENREKPKKTCGNALFSVDKSCGKPQGKRRKGFFRPASMLAILAFCATLQGRRHGRQKSKQKPQWHSHCWYQEEDKLWQQV